MSRPPKPVPGALEKRPPSPTHEGVDGLEHQKSDSDQGEVREGVEGPNPPSLPRFILDPILQGKIAEIRSALRHDDCKLVHITGPGKGVRTGKSSLGNWLCYLVDPSFTAKNTVWSPYGWNEKQNELGKGSALIKHEPRGTQRRQSMSLENREQQEVLTEWGHKNLFGVMIHPHIGHVDSAQLVLADYWVEIVVPRKLAVWHDILVQTVMGQDGRPTMRIRTPALFKFQFPDCNKVLPHIWQPYLERDQYYKATGQEPDYSRTMNDEDYGKLRKEYLKRRRLNRMRREMRDVSRPLS